MTRRSVRPLAILLVAILGVVGAACSNDSSSTKPGSKPAGNGGAFPVADMNKPQFEGTPHQGGELAFGLESKIVSLDPGGQMIQPADLTVGLALYDTLVKYDDKGRTTGNLAESFSSSPDLTTWTFKLRPNVKFGDGTPFNADAVVKHIERLKGLPTCSCASDIKKIASVEATDDLTVVFHLTGPNVAFPVFLSNSPGFVVSPTQVAKYGADYSSHPMGAGPFRLVTMGDSVTVERNPYYWRKDDQGRQLPYLDRIEFKSLPDSNTRLQAVQSQAVQIMQTADTGNLVDARKDKNLAIQAVTGSSATILILNSHQAPFDDIRAREALNYAIDRDALNQQSYQGARVPAYGFLPPTDPYYDPEGQLPHYDPDKARSLVAALKKDGKNVNFEAVCISTPEATTVFQVLKGQAEAVGVNVTLKQLDQATYVAKMLSGSGDFTAGCFRSPQIPDPNDVDSAIHTGGSLNLGKISDPAIDNAMDAGRATTDFAARKKQYDIVQQELAKGVYIVPMLFDLYGNIHLTSVSGLERPWPNSLGLISVGTLYLKK